MGEGRGAVLCARIRQQTIELQLVKADDVGDRMDSPGVLGGGGVFLDFISCVSGCAFDARTVEIASCSW